MNEKYGLCASYPRILVVPASVTDQEIEIISQFRSEQRLPVLCWGRQADSASIWRSSQPKVTRVVECREGLGRTACLDGLSRRPSRRALLRSGLVVMLCPPPVPGVGDVAFYPWGRFGSVLLTSDNRVAGRSPERYLCCSWGLAACACGWIQADQMAFEPPTRPHQRFLGGVSGARLMS